MKKQHLRNHRRKKKALRIRNNLSGTAQRPRLCVYRSLKHVYAQLVDDTQGQTLAAASTLKLSGKKLANGNNVEAAKRVGAAIAELAREKGVKQVVFDRAGYVFHGRIKALADAAREVGLNF